MCKRAMTLSLPVWPFRRFALILPVKQFETVWGWVAIIEGCNRPLLVKLNHSCDELSILANRHKLLQSSTPTVFFKPHQSPHERATEATLLHQRKLLIESGSDKKILEFVLTAFSSKRKSLAQLVLQISSSISLAVCGQQSYLRPSRNRRQLRCCGIQSVFCYSIIYYGIVPSNDHDPSINDQVNALFCFWNMAIYDSIYDQEVLPTNYYNCHKDRHSHGGGVMIAIWDTIPATAVNVSTAVVSNSIEVVSVNLLLCKLFTICCIYNPLVLFDNALLQINDKPTLPPSQSERDDLSDKVRSLQSNLDNTYRLAITERLAHTCMYERSSAVSNPGLHGSGELAQAACF